MIASLARSVEDKGGLFYPHLLMCLNAATLHRLLRRPPRALPRPEEPAFATSSASI